MSKHGLEWTTSRYLQELQGYGWIKCASANFISTLTVRALGQELDFRYGVTAILKNEGGNVCLVYRSFPPKDTNPRLIKLFGTTTKPIGFCWLISGVVLIRNSLTGSGLDLSVWFPRPFSGGRRVDLGRRDTRNFIWAAGSPCGSSQASWALGADQNPHSSLGHGPKLLIVGVFIRIRDSSPAGRVSLSHRAGLGAGAGSLSSEGKP